MTEEVLCAGISYDEIVHKYIDTVYRIALAQAHSKHDAEDVVQDVFLKLITSKTEFESEEHIKAWLIRVTINCSHKLFSSSWFKRTVPLSDEIPFETPEHSEVYYELCRLPEKYRIPLYLYYYEEYSVREIAECLGLNEGTVKSQLSRGRERLKNKLKGGRADV